MKRFNRTTISLLSSFLLMICLVSCSTTRVGFKQTYEPQRKITSNLSYDEVWGKVIDFFAENSIPITVIDKNSGIITASNVAVGTSLVTSEDKQGNLINPSAWFVVPYVKGCVGNTAICSFNVRVKPVQQESGDTSTEIAVNLTYSEAKNIIKYWSSISLKNELMTVESKLPCVSTGNFEKDLLNYFSR